GRPAAVGPVRSPRRGRGTLGARLLGAGGSATACAGGAARIDDPDGERDDDCRRRPTPRDDDGPDPSRSIAADGDPLSDRRGVHAGGSHRAGVTAVRAAGGGEIPDAGTPTAAVPALNQGGHLGVFSPLPAERDRRL